MKMRTEGGRARKSSKKHRVGVRDVLNVPPSITDGKTVARGVKSAKDLSLQDNTQLELRPLLWIHRNGKQCFYGYSFLSPDYDTGTLRKFNHVRN